MSSEKQWILTSCDGYAGGEMGPFRRSAAKWMPGAKVVEVSGSEEPPVVGRVFRWREVLAGLDGPGEVMLADGRDQVFQGDLFAALPGSGLHVFQEDLGMRIGSCPYNGLWAKRRYGGAWLEEVGKYPILCVGTVVGGLDEVRGLVGAMCREIDGVSRSEWFGGLEQAVFQRLVWGGEVPARVWANEEGPVYTVGYLPRESVEVRGGVVVNRSGEVPAAVHQWDRHQNLSAWVREVCG